MTADNDKAKTPTDNLTSLVAYWQRLYMIYQLKRPEVSQNDLLKVKDC